MKAENAKRKTYYSYNSNYITIYMIYDTHNIHVSSICIFFFFALEGQANKGEENNT